MSGEQKEELKGMTLEPKGSKVNLSRSKEKGLGGTWSKMRGKDCQLSFPNGKKEIM